MREAVRMRCGLGGGGGSGGGGFVRGGAREGKMMKAKKEVFGQRGAARDCRIVYAVVIGVTLGAFWAYLRPHGFFTPSSSLVADRHSGATSKVTNPKP
jgi:hypothetical protein